MAVDELLRDFLLESSPARELFRRVGHLPIVDYHSHLSVETIARNEPFRNLTGIWLDGDHYKWRAMRQNGVPEALCSGGAADYDKFEAWAATLPRLLRNPLFDWSRLELARYFGISQPLDQHSAPGIWDDANEQLRSDAFRPRQLLLKHGVEVLCTTDDPADSLEFHQALRGDASSTSLVLPTFRPDMALAIDRGQDFIAWVQKLADASGHTIGGVAALLEALRSRHDAFHAVGCRLSDHGLERCYAAECSVAQAEAIFQKTQAGTAPHADEVELWRSFLMRRFARWDHEKNWTMLLHLGAMRNNNTRMRSIGGSDVGCDSIGDFSQGARLNAFLDRLDGEGQLPRTILFNSNPADNLLFSTIAGNFFEDGVVGKVSHGPSWWFLDTRQGITDQFDACSLVGIADRFIGMVTDSRSFLSFTRHEYYRRVICNLYGRELESGLLHATVDETAGSLRAQFYENARGRFAWPDC